MRINCEGSKRFLFANLFENSLARFLNFVYKILTFTLRWFDEKGYFQCTISKSMIKYVLRKNSISTFAAKVLVLI